MPPISTHRLHTSPSARASISPDGLVILDVNGGVLLAANAVGARIWQLVQAACTAAEIEQRLVDEYGIPPDRAHADAATFLGDLMARGIVTQEGSR